MNTLIFTLIVLFFTLPIFAFLGLISNVLWYTLNTNSGILLAVAWQNCPLITWELQNTAPDWKDMRKQSDNSPDNSGW